MKKKNILLLSSCILLALSSCQSQQKQDNTPNIEVQEDVESNAPIVESEAKNRSAEDSLTARLITDLQTRVFPTEQEIEMWKLITEDNVKRDSLPLLGRALVRAFFGTSWWGEEGEPELKNNTKVFCPVIVDLTGDYGWYVMYPDSIWVSSNHSTYIPKELLSGGLMKPWCSTEGKTSDIMLSFRFDVSSRRLNGISMNNGFCHTEELWKCHGRVAKLQVLVDGTPYKTLDIEDTPFLQMLPIDSIPASTRPEPVVVAFQILEVYPGTKYNDVSIGNLYFSSTDSHD